MSNEKSVSKDGENQQPIPIVWRRTIDEIVEAFISGNFRLKGINYVRDVSAEDADRIARNLDLYGAHLQPLPEGAWETSACQWMGSYWDALVDLYTVEEGASDLALSLRVYEDADQFQFDVHSVHVP